MNEQCSKICVRITVLSAIRFWSVMGHIGDWLVANIAEVFKAAFAINLIICTFFDVDFLALIIWALCCEFQVYP